MLKHCINFLKGVFKSNGGYSSKRVVGFGCFLVIVEIGVANIWFNKIIDYEYLYTVAALLTACFGMNTILTNKAIDTKSTVASDIVTEQPSGDTADDAKDVLNSNKP